MANNNCLAGCQCPDCGNKTAFQVVAHAVFTVVDDGTDEGRNIEWDDASPAYCKQCEWSGNWGDLKPESASEAVEDLDENQIVISAGIDAAQLVVDCWSGGDLANAVNELQDWATQAADCLPDEQERRS